MSWGGKRDGAGRKINPLRTAKLAESLLDRQRRDYGAAAAPTPLEFILAEMWNLNNTVEVRRTMAIAALPFCSPKLQSVNVQHDDDNKLVIELIDFTKKSVTNGGEVTQSLSLSLPQPVVVINED